MRSIKLLLVSFLALLLVFLERFFPAPAVAFLAGGLLGLALALRTRGGPDPGNRRLPGKSSYRPSRRLKRQRVRGNQTGHVFVCSDCGYVHPQGVDFRYCPGCGVRQGSQEDGEKEEPTFERPGKHEWDSAPVPGSPGTGKRELSIERDIGDDRPANCPSCQYPLVGRGAECGNCGWGG